MKHILFIVGSFRNNSFNRQLANVAEEILKNRFHISYLDFKDIPYMNQDIEINGQQATDSEERISSVVRVREEVIKANGIWVFTPEYNRSYPGLLKNLFDWLSRPMDVSNFTNPTAAQGKKITLSGAGGKNRTISCRDKLVDLLEYMKMNVMKEPQTGIELGMEAWVKGEFHLNEQQLSELKEQAEKFASFVGE
ncbi:MAG: NAD(P)H-dependent oxidoreductase [Bacteroidales bacterium]|nr:NAD(P)H-dependent oxidoreductase [Bacteroidales bacterium]